ncbi:uncharacterized protein [Rutidosis leptorrhynchoides]|uniref:uncharacterized protein n=1 Tax=Rutidosis leptorrhynchoides TaxID=125765 RepID=UPI003A9A0B34
MGFKYHPKCKSQSIINLCFADDLFLFSHADMTSVKILNMMPFEEGKLPVRYLGVPLVSSRLLNRDCKLLMEMVRNRIFNWKSKFLSFAGRMQLISSVLVRCLLVNKQSLWVKWIHSYRLEDRSFWDVMVSPNASWSWGKLLHIRDFIKDHLIYKIGNGGNTSAWYDIWNDHGRLVNVLTRRNIIREGFNGNEMVCNIMHNGNFNWLATWLTEFPIPNNIDPPCLTNKDDDVLWKDLNGIVSEFSVYKVWETIRPRATCVPWFNVVWFKQCIPSHTFVVWLLMDTRLKTQDKLKDWERNPNNSLQCLMCNGQPDSHDHIFFECPFSAQLHMKFGQLAMMLDWYCSWKSTRDAFIPFAARNLYRMVVPKIVFAATVYFIW